MTLDKPEDIESYKKWLDQKGFKEAELAKYQSLFENVSLKLEDDFKKSKFWIDVQSSLLDWNDEYLKTTGYQLLAETRIVLLRKSYDSFLLKTFRKNILENKNWPDPPQDGWYLPNNWIIRTKDIVRTLIVVKYLDGVDFIVDKLSLTQSECTRCSNIDVSFEAREHGYYAAHLGIAFSTEILDIDFKKNPVSMNIEIQIATQLQDVIRKLTHKFYETRREKDTALPPNRAWQWNYNEPEFVPNYLGHLLHFVEGMIMEVRTKGDGLNER